jgi:REP-associated tyrosine transposase
MWGEKRGRAARRDMPRPLREEVEDGIHHVFARGNDRQAIYRDDHDRLLYLELLGGVVSRKRWRCLAFCLMDNHVHLLVQTPDANLGAGMQRLHGDYALLFNRRHRRVGHLFQGRFGSNLVTDDEELWTIARYIARNPVEAGRCRFATEWPWSSARGLLEGSGRPWVDDAHFLSFLAPAGGDPLDRFRELVDG